MQGLAFHCHHDSLCGYVTDYDERVAYIESDKPKSELALRLRLFKMIPKDKMPGKDSSELAAFGKAWTAFGKAGAAYDEARTARDKAWTAHDKAWTAFDEARTACDKAWTAHDKARTACDKARTALDKARTAHDKARAAYGKAWTAHDKARAAYFARYDTELRALHTELCPNCPWNGRTIFSNKGGEKGV